MQELIDYLLMFGQLNKQQIDLICRGSKILQLQKDDYFSEAGKTAKRVGFILKGIIRVCYYNKEGKEITRYFIEENNFVVDINSYTSQLPATEYLQAVTDCEMITFSLETMKEFSLTIIGWDGIIDKITAKALLEKVNKISPMLAEDATTRYHRFLEQYPNLANRIPLLLLASYIGVTQSSLSRIRKG
ncbi:DNA-binding transcriptional dual regulator Crp [compost metagenome]